jgi:hypothetical protein
LQGLGDQFDFTNAAGPELDVSARIPPTGNFFIDPALHAENIFDRLQSKGFRVDESFSHREKRTADRSIAGYRPGLEQSQSLPWRQPSFVVAPERLKRIRDVSSIALRT